MRLFSAGSSDFPLLSILISCCESRKLRSCKVQFKTALVFQLWFYPPRIFPFFPHFPLRHSPFLQCSAVMVPSKMMHVDLHALGVFFLVHKVGWQHPSVSCLSEDAARENRAKCRRWFSIWFRAGRRHIKRPPHRAAVQGHASLMPYLKVLNKTSLEHSSGADPLQMGELHPKANIGNLYYSTAAANRVTAGGDVACLDWGADAGLGDSCLHNYTVNSVPLCLYNYVFK